MRTLAIGDIHGSFITLSTLLNALDIQPTDRLVFLGDYIDRGPDSKKVLDLLTQPEAPDSRVFLRGNHEAMILDARESFLQADIWQSYGGLETAFSYGANYSRDWASAIPDNHWAFIENTLPFYETANHIFVHACLDPDLDLCDQPAWLLYWETLDKMQRHKSGKRIICGHTPQRSGKIAELGYAICIDTGSASGGWLTGLDVDSGHYWQTNERGDTRTGSLSK